VRHGRVESTRPFSVLRGGYRVYVEDQEVASGTARAQNWYIAYGVIGHSLGFDRLFVVALRMSDVTRRFRKNALGGRS